MNGNMQLPATSIRFKLSSAQDVRKHHEFEFHSFSRLQRSRWVCLDSQLLRHCLVIKQLPVSECTYDKIKELEHGSIEQRKPHDGLELSSFVGFSRKFVPSILPIGVSEEARNTGISGSALSTGEVPRFTFSFSAAPTFFLAPHLHLLMKNSSDWGNLHHHDGQHTPESSENGSEHAECTQMNPSLVAEHKIGTLDTEAPASFASSNEDLVADVALVTGVPEKAISRSDSQFGGITVDIPSCDQVSITLDGKQCISRQTSDVGSIVNEGFVHSPSPTGSGSSWKYVRSSSISSPLGDLSPMWSDASPKFMRTGFSNGPKRPRTQVQYTLPGAGYALRAKQKMQNQRTLPYRRRRASLKRISDGSRNNRKNFDLVACGANVLVTHGDKGWRELGALIVLEVADHNEWTLAVKLSGITKYSYKVKHILQPGSTNRYSHSVLWKGGKDWVLEFPDRNQWNLFKELYEECYNRNIRAASVKNIPIPGVQLIEESDDYETEVPFVWNSTRYIRQVQTDVEMAMDPSRILYDMDSDDEQWLMENEKWIEENRCKEISEEFLEKTMDMLEKVSYIQHRANFTDAEIQELAFGMGSVEAVKLVYEHWREKRERKGMPLIRHLQPPLWERYQRQLKEWEHTVARSNSAISVGTKGKVLPPEKPPMFAFCQKPRGLDVPNKGSKQRSHRKASVSGNFHAASGDHDGFLFLGKRGKGHPSGDERGLYTNSVHRSSVAHFSKGIDVSESNRNPKTYQRKSRKLSSQTSPSNHQTTLYNQRTSSEGPHGQGVEHLDSSYLDELRLRGAKCAAERAQNLAKLKRDDANRSFIKVDLAKYKAASAITIAEAVKGAAGESDGGN
ncbi:hypothetical protein CDL12_27619 [Handroanthus impetiginosus]|uniref:Enhancer of polycomb-like protein n=1 Tax=Handroanthus impetiginosus TaxID=429701 RepID=A0A2G9G3K1_9LAMI|nr:hypothetical protein CDL12_27619 [Handroanthus impetiginosus]